MKTRTKTKFNIFAMLGWLLWKLLALFGSRYAKKKLEQHRRRNNRSVAGSVARGVHDLTNRSGR